MIVAGMNLAGVLAAAVVAFMFGWVWYGMLGGLWLKALGSSEGEVTARGMQVRPLVINFIALIVMACVLAGIVAHFGPPTVRNGAITGTFVWLGFVITTLATNHAYQNRKLALTAIDGAHWLGA